MDKFICISGHDHVSLNHLLECDKDRVGTLERILRSTSTELGEAKEEIEGLRVLVENTYASTIKVCMKTVCRGCKEGWPLFPGDPWAKPQEKPRVLHKHPVVGGEECEASKLRELLERSNRNG